MKKTTFSIDDSLGFILSRSARALSHTLRKEMQMHGYDITPGHWGILARLFEADGITQQELACANCKDKTNITRLIDGLAKRNLIVRIPDSEDRRSNLVYLTEEGKELRHQLTPIVMDVLEEACKEMSNSDVQRLKELLNRVYQNLTTR